MCSSFRFPHLFRKGHHALFMGNFYDVIFFFLKAHLEALGTLSTFLQAFPAASDSEISFVEWSQGVCFFVCAVTYI